MRGREEFEAALTADNPVEALRSIAKSLSEEGYGRRQVYEIFLEFYKHLQDVGREEDENIVGDVMDMIMDTFVPFNLNLPE